MFRVITFRQHHAYGRRKHLFDPMPPVLKYPWQHPSVRSKQSASTADFQSTPDPWVLIILFAPHRQQVGQIFFGEPPEQITQTEQAKKSISNVYRLTLCKHSEFWQGKNKSTGYRITEIRCFFLGTSSEAYDQAAQCGRNKAKTRILFRILQLSVVFTFHLFSIRLSYGRRDVLYLN